MENKAEDYYDLPVDLLPSANFAGRPMSDISTLDGLYTMIVSSSPSSSENNDDEEFPIVLQHHPAAQGTRSHSTRRNKGPEIRISSPTREDLKPRLRSLSNDVKVMERPRLREKANTAPSGTISLIEFAKSRPRRAISARVGELDIERSSPPNPEHRRGDPGPVGRTVERNFSDAKSSPPRKPLPSVPGQRALSLRGSFSQKLRVQKTLKQKQMGKLKTDFMNYDARRGPNSANSMLATPRELYAIPEKQDNHDGRPRWQQVVQDKQPEISTLCSSERRSTNSISPKAASSAARPAVVQAHTSLRSLPDVKMEYLSRPPRIYVPGPICLEKHAANPRRDSVATLDPFDSTPNSAHRFSDMMVEEATIIFFDDLGVTENATEASVDRYWLEISRRYSEDYEQDAAWRKASISSVTETAPPSPETAHSLYGSRFSFSSASSNASSPPTVKNPRTLLGRFLSPSNSGTAFLRTPGIFERQARKWQTRHDERV